MAKIYTKTGDKGETGLGSGKRLRKDSLRVAAIGDLDELSSILGVCKAINEQDFKYASIADFLDAIQKDLFFLSADLTLYKSEKSGIDATAVTKIERWIDKFENELPATNHFLLLGGNLLGAHLHFARAVCRRAERALVALHSVEPLRLSIPIYLNRLSDLLYVMARFVNVKEGTKEKLL